MPKPSLEKKPPTLNILCLLCLLQLTTSRVYVSLYPGNVNYQVSILETVENKETSDYIKEWEKEQKKRVDALRSAIKKKNILINKPTLYYVENKNWVKPEAFGDEEIKVGTIATQMFQKNKPLAANIELEKYTDLQNTFKNGLRITSLSNKIVFDQEGEIVIQVPKKTNLFLDEFGKPVKGFQEIKNIDYFEVELMEWRTFSTENFTLMFFEPNTFVSFEENNFITHGHLTMGKLTYVVNIVVSTQPHYFDADWNKIDQKDVEVADDFDKLVDQIIKGSTVLFCF